jgi:hypothetical protein
MTFSIEIKIVEQAVRELHRGRYLMLAKGRELITITVVVQPGSIGAAGSSRRLVD